MPRGIKGSTPDCKESGCGEKAKAHGMCKKHWRRWRTANGVRCSIDGCDSALNAGGMCAAHYTRFKVYGDALAEIGIQDPAQRTSPARLRFYLRLNWEAIGDPKDCWIWAGACNGVYPMMRTGSGKQIGAHRYAYERFHGPVPNGWHVDHLCGNKHCVNPNHMEAVPNQVNILRGMADAIREKYGEQALLDELAFVGENPRERRSRKGVWSHGA